MSIQIKYTILQALHCTMLSACNSYLGYYLLEQGFATPTIGIVIAGAGLVSLLLQPYLGRLADRNPNIGWKRILLVLAIICGLAALVVIFSPSPAISAIFYGLEFAMVNCMLAMVNAACFHYNRQGIFVNYGIARAIGSAAFALTSLFLGHITLTHGARPVPIMSAVTMAIMILCIISLPYTPNENPVNLIEQQRDRKKESIFTFASKYKAFIIMTLSVLLAFSFHNMLISYLIHILGDLGGSSADLGKALFIAAIFEIPMMLFSNKILRRISAHRLLAFGAFAYIIRGVMMYFASSVNVLLISMTLQMLSFATITCASVHYAEVMMQEEDKVTGQSLMVLAASTSTATGSLSGGFVCDVYGVKNMLIFGTGLSLIAFVVALYSCAMTERKTHTM